MVRGPRKGIETSYADTIFRSRLESKWACLFDLLGWSRLWTYEPVDLPGIKNRAGKIPDFLLSFEEPVLFECKPAVTLAELHTERRALIAVASEWLCQPIKSHLKILDNDPLFDDLDEIDQCIADLEDIQDRGDNQHGEGRRVVVGGPNLHITHDDVATVDGIHAFGNHDGHSTLYVDGRCLLCGQQGAIPLPAIGMLSLWRQAGNATRWMPSQP